ncbi:hypothetical protein WMF26_13090 [Sorangium sp. So ce185]|uniref:hypothetical protein n=1 Tax=Sorangium sp. So ce185 TaxID=3133287 RepID=UPI003F5DDB6C
MDDMDKARSAVLNSLGMCAVTAREVIEKDIVKSTAVVLLSSLGLYLCSLVEKQLPRLDAPSEEMALRNLSKAARELTQPKT